MDACWELHPAAVEAARVNHVDRLHAVVEGDPLFPDRIPDLAGEILDIAAVAVHEQDVEVASGRQLAAPVAADRHHRQPLARSAVMRRVKIGNDVIVDRANQLVDEESLSFRAIMSG